MGRGGQLPSGPLTNVLRNRSLSRARPTGGAASVPDTLPCEPWAHD